MTIYGPYIRDDGRKHVIHYDPETKKRRTQSYPRYLMEQHLGRKLEDWETVDHINEDFTDDRLENYQLLTRAENAIKSIKPKEVYKFFCPPYVESFQRKRLEMLGPIKREDRQDHFVLENVRANSPLYPNRQRKSA